MERGLARRVLPLVVTLSLPLGAEGRLASRPIGDLLPTDAEASPWRRAGEPLQYHAGTLSQFIDGGAELYLEYGFVLAVSQEYLKGDESLVCTIYEMTGPEAAFGVFSHGVTSQKARLELGDGGLQSDLQVAFWQERYFVMIDGFSPGDEPRRALLSLARAVSDRIGLRSGPPPILARLSRLGRVAGTEKLVKGRLIADALYGVPNADAVQSAKSDVLLSADYEGTRGKVRMFLLISEERGRIEDAWRRLGPSRAGPAGSAAPEPDAVERMWSDGDRYAVARLGPGGLALIVGAASPAEARAILDDRGAVR